MAHYAKVINGIVDQVIVAEPEFFDTFVDSSPGEWVKTSYNMSGGVYHVNNAPGNYTDGWTCDMYGNCQDY